MRMPSRPATLKFKSWHPGSFLMSDPVPQSRRVGRMVVEKLPHEGVQTGAGNGVTGERCAQRAAGLIGRRRIEDRARVDRNSRPIATGRGRLLRLAGEPLGEIPV